MSHQEDDIKKSLKGLLNISTIPLTLKKVLEVVDDEHSNRDDLVNVIEHDQSLATKIITVANNAFYGFSGKVTDISSAAAILGFDMIKSLSISVTLFKTAGDKTGGYLRGLWQHSFEVALASRLLAERTGLVRKEDAFLAGLTNDLGRVLLYQIHGEEYITVASGGKEGLLAREVEAFGATHSQIGAWFVDNYKFRKDCVLAISLHHDPEKFLEEFNTGSLSMVPIVYLADQVVSDGKEGFEIDLSPSERADEIMESVYIDPAGLFEVKEELAGMQEEITAFFAV